MTQPIEIDTDVLVVGGGLAATWAAVGAARAGARVVLADKGWCGTSGVTAAAGPGHWWVPPGGRREAVERQMTRSRGLGDPDWMARVLDLTWRTLPTLAPYYDFPRDEAGQPRYRALRGPEYLAAMRRLVEDLGVTILDHSPALELMLHADGSVAGARGWRRQTGEEWSVRAGAVVLATGGCAFMAHLLGADTNTGDGLLMAAEAGADLSGMEFSGYHTVAQARTAQTRSVSYAFATYFAADGRELDIPPGEPTRALARALTAGPVFCSLDRMPAEVRQRLHLVQPAVVLSFQRAGIDPFNDRFEITLRGEGTVRGVGGLKVVNAACETRVSGLFAAGDVASRELVSGAISGGGAQNSAWAVSSGQWAGEGAADLAQRRGSRAQGRAVAIGAAGLRPIDGKSRLDAGEIVRAVQAEALDYDKTLFRTAPKLTASLDRLESVWRDARDRLGGDGRARLKAREAAAMTAAARWCAAAALVRQESRGLHHREDAAREDPRQQHRLTVSGLDALWVRAEDRDLARETAA